jgi:hypothetical protein
MPVTQVKAAFLQLRGVEEPLADQAQEAQDHLRSALQALKILGEPRLLQQPRTRVSSEADSI